ncbi:hypothetical protein [Pyrobaculum calidifontis]|uniref:Phospholipase C/D domain-containing protein n=1 Tax=Pyrobaculum calidifontis (strain DSM 21063 / JCM 11548 / VA1) TaxID=410359 RepID=A3MSL7_PYRCJ|nr:hypothetical protein [Pyrobaculum calidifontis]ABO07634.1 conserved hypothetical protein [Pyrobaculum calidifontis JCM 11548]
MPSWRVHRALVLLAAREVGLPEGLLGGLLRGVVEPDEVPDKVLVSGRRRSYFRRVGHHGQLHRALVEYYYNLACFYRARGDLYSAGRALGRAAHYLQDAAVKTRKWLIFDVHDEVEAEMGRLVGSLPHVCSRPAGDAAVSLCKAYADTVQLFRRFVSEPVVDRATGRRLLWRGRLKKWSAIAALGSALVASVFAALAWGFLASVAGLYLALRWTPGEYVAAMRAGVHRVEPPGYETAM